MKRFRVGDTELDYEVFGSGEPVLLIHLSLIADGLACPLLSQAELAGRYQLIHYHRRGYIGSMLGTEPLTIARQAADAAALLQHPEVKTAHSCANGQGEPIRCSDRRSGPGTGERDSGQEPRPLTQSDVISWRTRSAIALT